MEIRELNLAAFGPFTNRTLVFDQEARGLHIVFGPNEAGKSSALRGLKALLYGIEERTLDNFLHPNDKLRILGRVRAADRRELAFARRKGRKKTLLGLDGEPLDEKALAPFLQGVTPELFETLFGIDHPALVQGGQEILEQKGEVGQALFSASLGSHALHAVLGRLDEEADELFRPRGSTQRINSSLKSYAQLNKEIRDRSLSSREWDEQRRALGRTAKALDQVHSDLAGNRVEVNRLQRIQRVLPKLAGRRELEQELGALGEVVILPDDFRERRQRAVTELEKAQAIIQKAGSRLKGLAEQLESVSVRQALLEHGESIEALHERLGGHRKAMQDRPHLEAERGQLITDAESLLMDVRPGLGLADVEQLHPVLARRQRIAELGNQGPVLFSRSKQAENTRRETVLRLEAARTERQRLPEAGSPESLRRAITAARKSGDLDASIQSGRSELATLEERCAADISRLTLWGGSLVDLPGLPTPAPESIVRYEEEYAELEKRGQRLREKQAESADALQEASRRLDEIQRAGSVPTEEDLIGARTDRDRTWKLLRRHWIDGEDVDAEASKMDAERALPDAFEHRLGAADELADRLRREADRVSTRSSLQAQLEDGTQRARAIARQRDECNAEKSRIDSEWQALWASCEVQPGMPREMRAWLDNLEKLRDRVGQLNALRQRVEDLGRLRDTHIRLLKQQLDALGRGDTDFASLETALLESEGVADRLEELKRQRGALDKEIKTLEQLQQSAVREQQVASDELAAWQEHWRDAIEGLGLQGDASPSEVADVTEKLREMFAKQNESNKLRIRILAIDKDAGSFREQVGNLVAGVAPELTDTPVDEAVVRLNALLSKSRAGQSRRQQIQDQLQQAQRDIQDSEATIQTMTARLDALCLEAKRGSPDDLEEAERTSAEYLRLKLAIAAMEQAILEAGEGITLRELETESEDIDPDELRGKIDALTSRIDAELEPKRTELAQAKGREEKELELMDGSDQAAALADQAQAVLAGIRSDAERYVRVKLAGRVLRDEIERYRKENQGPLVKRASEHFALLTRGSFHGLRTDFNEKDEPVLAGVRPEGESVYVEGMSNGTRDQLYLALRLASLEKYMESSEPMPFIVDDILVDFDDARSEAALRALADLSEKTQVILFTHHSKVVEQARGLPGSAQAQVHEL